MIVFAGRAVEVGFELTYGRSPRSGSASSFAVELTALRIKQRNVEVVVEAATVSNIQLEQTRSKAQSTAMPQNCR